MERWSGRGRAVFLVAVPLPHRGMVKGSLAQPTRKTTIGYSYAARGADDEERSALRLRSQVSPAAGCLGTWRTQLFGRNAQQTLRKPQWKAMASHPLGHLYLPSKPKLLETSAPSRSPSAPPATLGLPGSAPGLRRGRRRAPTRPDTASEVGSRDRGSGEKAAGTGTKPGGGSGQKCPAHRLPRDSQSG